MKDAGVGIERLFSHEIAGIVGWVHSAIMTAVVVGQRNWGRDAVALESHALLPQRIRAITYRW